MTVPYNGKLIDPISLWADYVEFPANFTDDGDEFSPLVVCPNPEHNTTKRHFQINLRKPLVHCFAGCGISGSYEDAIAKIEGVTNRQARRTILKHTRVGSPKAFHRARGKKSTADAPLVSLDYHRFLPSTALDYLDGRGISEESIARWELGWLPEERRIVIPIKDHHGRLKMLCKRGISEKQQPKYLYTEGVERNSLLFGACLIDPGMVSSQGVILVEGAIDCIILHQHGFHNAVAILGSKVSEIQARIVAGMRPKRVYTMFDADGAGVEATFSAGKRIHGTPIRVCRYPRGKSDPAVLTQREAARVIERAILFSDFKRTVQGYGASKPKERNSVG